MSSHAHLVETLESRRLLATVALSANGILRVVGDDALGDAFVLSLSDDEVSVVANGAPAQLFDKAEVRLIRVHGRGGDDTVTIDETNGALGERVEIDGGAGNDILNGSAGAERITGGEGDDQINGNGGSDWINGAAGDDVITAGNGRDVIYGGPGNDDVTAGGGRDFVRGGIGNDTLRGNAGFDTLFGEHGNDEIHGDEDADVVIGGLGNDVVHAGEGNNFIFALDGSDTVTAGSGNDRAFVGTAQGGDQVDLGAGRNVLREITGRDLVRRFHREFSREIGFLLRHLYELR
jgi:Ca2+-binding RTX toxin-like protein